MLAGCVAVDDHTKPQHMGEIQIHQHPDNKNEWAISSAQLLHLPYAATSLLQQIPNHLRYMGLQACQETLSLF